MTIVRSRNVVTPGGTRAASIHMRDGRIERVSDFDDVPAGAAIVDYGELTVMAGLVDSHVHINEPGRTEWEGFESATRAAAAGGVTTIVDMPLNSLPPTTSVAALMTKAEAMEGKCRVDVGLWGGAVPGNAPALPSMLQAGALGFKCFLIDSGVPEFGHLDAAGLRAALESLRDQGSRLLVHAELPGPIAEAASHLHGDVRTYARYLASRPPSAEDQAIELLINECDRTRSPAHVVHLSSANSLERIDEARDAGIPFTAETTPHYLHFDAESIPSGATEFKCAPPIREHSNREELWEGVHNGLFTAIVSDHSPCHPSLKRADVGDFEAAWGGIASLQFGLPIVWTEARQRGMTPAMLSSLMSVGPAFLAGLSSRKGAVAPGFDADLVVWNPEETFTVHRDLIQHKHAVTPYLSETLFGVVKATWLRGEVVWDGSSHIGTARGGWVHR